MMVSKLYRPGTASEREEVTLWDGPGRASEPVLYRKPG